MTALCAHVKRRFFMSVLCGSFLLLCLGGGQVLIYGILDIISKAVFGLILMSGASTGYEAI